MTNHQIFTSSGSFPPPPPLCILIAQSRYPVHKKLLSYVCEYCSLKRLRLIASSKTVAMDSVEISTYVIQIVVHQTIDGQ